MKKLRILGSIGLCFLSGQSLYGLTTIAQAQELLSTFSKVSNPTNCMTCLLTNITSESIGTNLMNCLKPKLESSAKTMLIQTGFEEAAYPCEMEYVMGTLLTPMGTTCKSSCS